MLLALKWWSTGTSNTKALTGSLSFVGSIATRIITFHQALSGSLSFVGSFGVRISIKALTASVTPAGSIVRFITRAFTASETPTGVVIRGRFFTAALTFAGSIGRAIGRILVQASINFSIALSFSGNLIMSWYYIGTLRLTAAVNFLTQRRP